MIKFLKELRTAKYDPYLDKIEGCTPGGIAWYHEDRHRQQFQKAGNVIDWITIYSTVFGAGFAFISLIWWDYRVLLLSGIAYIPYSIILSFLEADAWIYSIRQYSKNNEGDDV